MTFLLAMFRYLPTLIRADREVRIEGIDRADRRADWWGNLAALEAKRVGSWW